MKINSTYREMVESNKYKYTDASKIMDGNSDDKKEKTLDPSKIGVIIYTAIKKAGV